MLLTMKAPVSRDKGQRTVRCNAQQASILRKVGWTEVEQPEAMTQHIPIVTTVAAHYLAEAEQGSPQEQTLEPEPVKDPDEVRPKRKYTRRIVTTDENGNVYYKKKPKRQYRRRDMTAED